MPEALSQQDYYDVLEVQKDAPHHVICQAYRNAKEAYSPDSPALYTMFTKAEAEELNLLIEEAFSILGNELKRREYDLRQRAHELEKNHMKIPGAGAIALDPAKPELSLLDATIGDIPLVSSNTIESYSNFLPLTAPVVEDQSLEPPLTIKEPEGYKKTRFGLYKTDDLMELEIHEATEFDGSLIKKIRLYKKITTENMCDEIRISKVYLGAIENSQFDLLPAPVFVRGFIIQMARVLELNESAMTSSFMKIYQNFLTEKS